MRRVNLYRLVTDERGGTIVEYALVIALVGGACIAALLILSERISPLLTRGSNAFGGP